MTLDDGTAIGIASAIVIGLATTVGVLWKSAKDRHRSEILAHREEIGRLVKQLDDVVERVRELEKEKSKRADAYADRLEKLLASHDTNTAAAAESISGLARIVKQLAENVNRQTEAISNSFDDGRLPKPHPAAKEETGALERDKGKHNSG